MCKNHFWSFNSFHMLAKFNKLVTLSHFVYLRGGEVGLLCLACLLGSSCWGCWPRLLKRASARPRILLSRLPLPSSLLRHSVCWVLLQCYITVNSAMAASQNGLCSYKLSSHKQTNIMQIMTKIITLFNYLIFYHREIVKLEIILWHFPSS